MSVREVTIDRKGSAERELGAGVVTNRERAPLGAPGGRYPAPSLSDTNPSRARRAKVFLAPLDGKQPKSGGWMFIVATEYRGHRVRPEPDIQAVGTILKHDVAYVGARFGNEQPARETRAPERRNRGADIPGLDSRASRSELLLKIRHPPRTRRPRRQDPVQYLTGPVSLWTNCEWG